jgi:hypothetical protein
MATAMGNDTLMDRFIDDDDTQAYQDRVALLYKELGVEGDGWVSTEHYDDIHVLNQEHMRNWDETVAGGPYPITDGAPSWFVT